MLLFLLGEMFSKCVALSVELFMFGSLTGVLTAKNINHMLKRGHISHSQHTHVAQPDFSNQPPPHWVVEMPVLGANHLGVATSSFLVTSKDLFRPCFSAVASCSQAAVAVGVVP